MRLSVLSDVVDELAACDPGALGDRESIVELYRQLARLEAVATRACAAFDASRVWEADGAKTAAAWLATRCRVPKQQARRRVGLGRRLRHLPVCERAWVAGEITAQHVGTIAAVRRPGTEELLARDEKVLVDAAKELRFDGFCRTVAYWDQCADPDGAEDADGARTARRDVYLTQSFDGMWLGKTTLDPISGAIVGGELGRLEKVLFASDWAAAKQRLGREPTVFDLDRTPGQRRADALVEMATRSAACPADVIRPEPLFSVFVGYETLHGRICELANGTVITPGALVAWLDQAVIERAVFGPDNRVEVSKKSRLFTGATRRAIELRDRQCTDEFCDEPGDRCQVDHIVDYSKGGETSQDNGELRCGFDNRRKYQHQPPHDHLELDDDNESGPDP